MTKFTTQRIPDEIISDFTKVGPLKIVSFKLVSLKLFPLKVVHSNLFPFDQTGLDEVLAIMRYQIEEYSEADLGLVQHPIWSALCYYHIAFHRGCCRSPRSASDIFFNLCINCKKYIIVKLYSFFLNLLQFLCLNFFKMELAWLWASYATGT